MADTLTLEQLAARTGEPVERLRDWQARGLIGRTQADGFLPEDAERAYLVQLCLRRGIAIDSIARADRELDLFDRYMDMLFPQGIGPARISLPEAAETLGVDLGLLERVLAASGWPGLGDLREVDIEGLRIFKTLMDAGFPEDALVQGTRVLADSLGRVAEMESRIFHIYVHERLKAEGVSGRALMEATQSAGERITPLVEPMILHFHRLGWERAVLEDLVDHMAEEAGLLPPSDVPGELTRAIAFVDLASFTPLAAEMGDAAAAQVLERFSEVVRAAVNRWEGRIVKQIGDAFMAVFPEPRLAVAAALEIVREAAREPQFPAVRAGIHWGTVLYREGDYVGSNVNIASRLATEADRHQILVTSDVRREARDIPGVEFVRLGKRKLKGLSGSYELFAARAVGEPEAGRVVDPVCGMEMGPAEVAARLSLEGAERDFCSEACLRKFVVAPEKYGG